MQGQRRLLRAVALQEKPFYHGGVERTSPSPRVAPARRFCLPGAPGVWLALGVALSFPVIAGAQDRLKVAVVDVAKIFAGYHKTKEVERNVQDARQAAEREIETRQDNRHRLMEEVARLDKELADPALADPARAERRKKREDKVQETRALEGEAKEFRASRDRALQELTTRLRNQIVEDIMTVVRARVESAHYDLVLNKSAQGPGNKTIVLHANPSLEITDDVINTLNNNLPGAKPTASPEP